MLKFTAIFFSLAIALGVFTTSYDAFKRLLDFKRYKWQAIAAMFNMLLLEWMLYDIQERWLIYYSVFDTHTFVAILIFITLSALIIAWARYKPEQ